MRWRRGGWVTGARRLPSPNFGQRPDGAEVELIVIHSISLPPDQFGGDAVERFFMNRLDAKAHPYYATIAHLKVSSHFYVRRGGRIVQFVGCAQRAWHAGQSSWRGRENCNDYSVGIELEGSDERPFSAAQYRALETLVDALCRRYPIKGIVGHCHVAPGRKTDPGPRFDWSALRTRYPTLESAPEESP